VFPANSKEIEALFEWVLKIETGLKRGRWLSRKLRNNVLLLEREEK
jgi:hypothetical protein